jgi:hypothetical protein
MIGDDTPERHKKIQNLWFTTLRNCGNLSLVQTANVSTVRSDHRVPVLDSQPSLKRRPMPRTVRLVQSRPNYLKTSEPERRDSVWPSAEGPTRSNCKSPEQHSGVLAEKNRSRIEIGELPRPGCQPHRNLQGFAGFCLLQGPAPEALARIPRRQGHAVQRSRI